MAPEKDEAAADLSRTLDTARTRAMCMKEDAVDDALADKVQDGSVLIAALGVRNVKQNRPITQPRRAQYFANIHSTFHQQLLGRSCRDVK